MRGITRRRERAALIRSSCEDLVVEAFCDEIDPCLDRDERVTERKMKGSGALPLPSHITGAAAREFRHRIGKHAGVPVRCILSVGRSTIGVVKDAEVRLRRLDRVCVPRLLGQTCDANPGTMQATTSILN